VVAVAYLTGTPVHILLGPSRRRNGLGSGPNFSFVVGADFVLGLPGPRHRGEGMGRVLASRSWWGAGFASGEVGSAGKCAGSGSREPWGYPAGVADRREAEEMLGVEIRFSLITGRESSFSGAHRIQATSRSSGQETAGLIGSCTRWSIA
jgi:hypothetical protein